MNFGSVPVRSASGGILAHSLRVGTAMFRKGRVLTQSDLEQLAGAGFAQVTIARLSGDDVGEDLAAQRIAAALAGNAVRIGAPFTGRANLYAEAQGLVCFDPAGIAAANAINEAITIATLEPFERVEPGQMIATVKIIPFGAPAISVDGAEQLLAQHSSIAVAPFVPKRIALISTATPGMKETLLDRNRTSLDARVCALGSSIVFEKRVAHSQEPLVAAIVAAAAEAHIDPILIFGASAITDRRDVVPAAIVQAGGVIEHFGMPVDPGNLLLLGRLHGTAIVGLPGCARSPKVNGFDFVLQRLLAGLKVSPTDITAMGVGGLLKEIPTRPQPRDAAEGFQPTRAPRVAAIVLAAGLSTRMGRNKLVADIRGTPLLRLVVENALESVSRPVIVVTGNEATQIEQTLSNLPLSFVRNLDFRDGLSTSLIAGVRAVPADCDGAIVLLGDMPGVSAQLIDRMIAAFDSGEDRAVCVATHHHKRGNPVLWSRRFFPEIMRLKGDVGAKSLLAEHSELVCEVEAGDEGPLVDIDTPDALQSYAGRHT